MVNNNRGSWDQETIPERVKVSDIIVDQYQGHVNKSLVEHIAKNWDEDAAGAIVLNLRKNGTYAAVDGQHRVLAARIAKIESLRALVFIEKTPKQEAELFVMLNRKHNVQPLDRFRANLFAGCTDEKNVNAALEEVGLGIAAAPGWRANFGKHILCVGRLMEIYRNFGLAHFKTVVGTLASAYKGYDDPKAYVAEAFGGLSQFIFRYPDADLKRVIQKLSERAPTVMLGMAAVKRDRGQDASMGWGKALTSLYNAGYRRNFGNYLSDEVWNKKMASPAGKVNRIKSAVVQLQLAEMREKRFKPGNIPHNKGVTLKAAKSVKKDK